MDLLNSCVVGLSFVCQCNNSNSGSRIDGLFETLGFFIPKITEWFPNAVRHTYRIESSRKIKAFLRHLIEEHQKTFVKGQTRDLTDAYLELSESSDPESSFHSNGKEASIQRAFSRLKIKTDF